jgi:hypothetical protein
MDTFWQWVSGEAGAGWLIGLLTLAATIFMAARRKKKILEYSVMMLPLIMFTPSSRRALTVTVNKWYLTRDEADEGVPKVVNRVYGTRIVLHNVGDDTIINPWIEVRLDPSATIVESEVWPKSKPGYEHKLKEPTKPNLFYVQVPYINQHEYVQIRLISIENADSTCLVSVMGSGVTTRPTYGIRREIEATVSELLPMIIWVILVITLDFAPAPILAFIGSQHVSETVSRLKHPWWIWAITFCVIGISIVRYIVNSVRRSMQFMDERWMRWD